MTNKKKEDKDYFWKPVKIRHVVQDKWIDFRSIDYQFPNGKIYGPYYQYSRKNYVIIVPVTEDKRFICVRQFRQGISQVTTEFPAGAIEQDEKECLQAAQRELQEETGYASENWKHLITIPSDATIADNYATVYLALNCHKISSQHLDETEDLEMELLTKEDIENLIQNGKFQQMGHVMAYLLALGKL